MHRPNEGNDGKREEDDGEGAALHAREREAITDCHGQIVEPNPPNGNLGRRLYVP